MTAEAQSEQNHFRSRGLPTLFSRAIVRAPGADFAQGITTAQPASHDYERMLRQHADYVRVLRSLGLAVTVLGPLPGCPDAYFVEDTAVILPEIAVISRPGAPERRGEIEAIAESIVASIEAAVIPYRPIVRIEPPGTLDGGDVLIVNREAFIGLSGRTNQAGVEQLGSALRAQGYTWTAVPVGEALHLKSGVNVVGENTLLVTRAFAACDAFRFYNRIIVPEGEEYAANTLQVNGTLLVPSGFPQTCEQLSRLGQPIIEVDVSESRKMDGGLTCLSLRF